MSDLRVITLTTYVKIIEIAPNVNNYHNFFRTLHIPSYVFREKIIFQNVAFYLIPNNSFFALYIDFYEIMKFEASAVSKIIAVKFGFRVA